MRTFFLNIFLLTCISSYSQQSVKITYKYIPRISDGRTMKLIVTDTASYEYTDLKGFTPKIKGGIYGVKIIHHSNFYFPNQKLLYSTMGLSKPNPYMFTYKPQERIWIPLTDTKVIEGYECKGMLNINEKGDSILVFYSDKLAAFGAPLFEYHSVPGVVLEVTDQSRALHLIATEIEKGDYKIIFPKDMEVVSADERDRRVIAARNAEQ